MTNSYCQPTEANFWFPVAPGVTSLPANPLPTTNPVPLPANAVAVPVGFDESNPDLCELFETILPTGVDPVYPVTVDPTQSVPPYQETVLYNLRVRVLSTLETFNYSIGVVTEVPVTIYLGFSQDVSYPPQPTISIRLSTEVLVDFRDYQEAILGISLKNNTVSLRIIVPKVLIHFNGDRTSQQVFDQTGYATINPGAVRITDSLSKFNGSSGRIYAPNDRIKITYPGPAMTYEQAWSVDFWFYIPGSTSKSTYCLYSFNDNASASSGIYLYAYPGNTYYYIYTYVNEVTNSYFSSGGNLLDSWNHCIITKNPYSHTLNTYINGASRGSRNFISAYNMWNDTQVHSLGGDFREDIDRAVNGWLAEFRQVDEQLYDNLAIPTEPYNPLSNDWHLRITTSLKTVVQYVVLTIISEATIVIRLKTINYLDKLVQTVKYTGNSANGRVISTPGVAPHLISIRSSYTSATFYDRSRGAGSFSYWYYYNSWLNDASTVQSFGSDTFTIGTSGAVNNSGSIFYATVFGNTDIDYVDTSGSISTTIAANRNWGFSVIRYSGNGSNSLTKIPHGLSTAPALIFMMMDAYYTNHTYLWGTAVGTGNWIQDSMYSYNTVNSYNNVYYDNTYINHSYNGYLNATYPITLYCFTGAPGRTKVGTYNGYNELNIYIETGFKPTYIMIRRKSGGIDNGIAWLSYDKTLNEAFDPFGTAAAATNTTVVFGINGFTILANSNQNITGAQYIYYAMRGPLEEAVLAGENLSLSTANSSTQLIRQAIMDSQAYDAQLGEQEAVLESWTYLLSGEPSSTTVAGGTTGNTPAFVAADVFSMQLGAIDTNLRGSDIYHNNTSLLLHMNGTNNSTTFTDNSINAIAVTPSGDAKISTQQSKFGGASAYLDGAGDRLVASTNTLFDFSTGDFTVELWVYHIAIAADRFYVSAAGSGGLFFGIGSGAGSSASIGWGRAGVAWDGAATHGMSINTWNHVALCRSGTSMRMFVNGAQIGSTVTNSTSYNLSTTALNIGSQGANYYLNAYIDELRITKGVARYTTAFTPLNRPFFDTAIAEDPSFSSVSLLMHMDGANASTSFVDSSDSMLNLTANGNVQLSTALSVFGGASALFDGTGDFLSRAYDAKFDFVLSDFTFEAWIRPTAFRTGGTRIMSTGGGTVGWNSTTGIHTLIQLDPTGKINLQLSNNTGTPVSVVSANGVSLNVWSLISVSVSGSNAYIAVNGVSSIHALATRAKPSTNPQIAIGTIPGEAGAVATAFVGNMDEVRLTKGVARYTASYTAPGAPFPSF